MRSPPANDIPAESMVYTAEVTSGVAYLFGNEGAWNYW
jgi:hypothetical protein